MTWDGKERRKAWRCDSHEQIAVDLGVIKEKVSKSNELVGALVDEVKNVNDRCLTHIADYQIFNQHIKDGKENKSFWRDTRVKVVFAVFVFIQAVFMLFLTNVINKENRIIGQTSPGVIRADTQQER